LLTPDQVTAVIVTRGDVDLAPVLESLVFDDVFVWNNAERTNEMTYARVLGAELAYRDVIYSQDDDIIHSEENQLAILAAYQPGTLTGCMWQEWSAGAHAQGISFGYDDLVFPGSGSIADRSVAAEAVSEYLSYFPFDDFFRLWCDTIVGVIAPTKQLDIRFEALPCAEDENRMCNLPDGLANKTEAIRRARWIRSGAHVRAIA
jgi:hypothetical protein